jgi:hypothetical protein
MRPFIIKEIKMRGGSRQREYSFDSKCYDLAEHFVQDENICPEDREKILNEMAQDIQDAVEDFFTFDLDKIRGEDGKMYRRIKNDLST